MALMTVDQSVTKENSPTLSTILNDTQKNHSQKDMDVDAKDFLPTPVTPAAEFGQFHKDSYGTYSTFSVIKPPMTNTSLRNTNMTTEQRPYPCPECNLTFSRPHNLKSHLTTHSSERPYQCNMCDHHFRRQHDLKRHQKLHTGERPYRCSDCYRSFARQDALNRHRRAEGGTACSMVHQAKKEFANNNATLKKTTNTRPVIPQLHIPQPTSTTPQNNALPPITHIKPIYHQPKSLPTTPSSPQQKFHPYLSPHQPWSSPKRLTLPPLASPPTNESQLDRLKRENEELKRDMDQLRAIAQRESSALQSRIHDLEVENKVLRSLIHDGSETKSSNE